LYLSQVEQVLSLSQRLSGGKVPWVVAGDFNAGELAAPEAWDLWGSDLKGSPPLITWDSSNPLVSGGLFPEAGTADLDHVLWPRDSGLLLVSAQTKFGGEALSDHEALEVSLTVPNGPIKLSPE
jgi:endonuclease/exonuclease/phosphatase family metal-dependent hydrolase